ncbi:MAG TPA: hypothetical protein VKZ82_27305 [Nonomuraea sp.]|nr:hypothetical protein [Nonomuraea sp.]
MGWSLSQSEGVEVFMVSEKEPGEEGWVLVRVRARGFADEAPASQTARCFRIEASSWDADLDEAECPPGSPRTFRSPAEIPGRAFDWLKEHLPVTPDLEEARRVVRALDLDDRIKQDVALVDGVLGVALREGPGECLFARVRFGTVQVWKPARIQVMPGEGVCGASEAAYGFAQRPPH